MAVPTQDQIMGQLRVIIPALGTIVSAIGINSVQVNYWVGIAMAAVGPIAYIAVALWSLVANSRASIMASAAQPVAPGVPPPQIVLPVQEAALAQTLPNNVNTTETKKVVSQ
jgi:hypothetical protein